MIRIPAEGPITSNLIFIGEAPARQECLDHAPFRGSSGYYFDNLLKMNGLPRNDSYVMNLSEEPAPNYKMVQMPKEKRDFWKNDLIERINMLPNPKILVPMGDYALEAVTDHHGITNLRGSVLRPSKQIRHDCIVVPTFHPSKMHYDYECWPLISADFGKVKSIIDKNYKYVFPEFNFITRPSLEQVLEKLNDFRRDPEHMYTIDVETPHSLLSCFGIGWSRYDSICIPFFWGTGRNYWTESEELTLWKMLGEILPKLNLNNQNFMFDWEVLSKFGLWLRIPKYDPMLMHHCLYVSLPHSLDCITSLCTDMPFYKRDTREEKGLKGSALLAGREEEHWKYNNLDCCSAWWAIETLIKDLKDENLFDVYNDLYQEMFEPIFKINILGVKVNVEKLVRYRKELNDKNIFVLAELQKAAGHEINPNSPKQVKKFLIEELGMTGYKIHGKVSTAKECMKKMAYKHHSDLPLQIVEFKANAKALGLFTEDNIVDGRIKCQYSLGRAASGTEGSDKKQVTGRLASKKPFDRKGMNLQNVKRGRARMFFIPEEGHVFIGADQMQAEARFVAWYSRDPKMQEIVDSGRMHFKNAENLFHREVEKGSDDYQKAKALVHAGNYDIGKFEFARTLNIDSRTANIYLSLYHKTYPGIRKVYHKYVQDELKKTRMLHNVFGRRLFVTGRLDRETFKLGYSFLPQSGSGDLTKMCFKKMHAWCEERNMHDGDNRHVALELHDGLIISVPQGEIRDGAEALVDAYNVPFNVWGIEHTVPVEVEVGDNWLDMEKLEI